jgi:protein involved in polysaccharide export with SLBB domain
MGEREALGVGDRVRVIYDSPTFKDKVGVIAAINSKGTASIALDGMASEYTFEAGEFERVEGGAA